MGTWTVVGDQEESDGVDIQSAAWEHPKSSELGRQEGHYGSARVGGRGIGGADGSFGLVEHDVFVFGIADRFCAEEDFGSVFGDMYGRVFDDLAVHSDPSAADCFSRFASGEHSASRKVFIKSHRNTSFVTEGDMQIVCKIPIPIRGLQMADPGCKGILLRETVQL